MRLSRAAGGHPRLIPADRHRPLVGNVTDALAHLFPTLAQQFGANLGAGLQPPATGMPIEFWRIYWISVATLFGLLWGSFFNVCIYRVPAGLSVVAPRSYCYTCGTMVAARDNIPVLSWLLLGGCCRHCGTRLSARYAGIELLTGVLFGALAWRFLQDGQPTGALIGYMVFAGFLIIATFTDIDHFIIPDGISLGSGVAGVFAAGVAGGLGQFGLLESGLIAPIGAGWPFESFGILGAGGILGAVANATLGGVFAAGMLWLVGIIGSFIFRKEAMGMGDVKLMVGIGAFLGVVHSVVAFFAACVLGAIISLSWMGAQYLSGRKAMKLGERFPATGGAMQEAFDAESARLAAEGGKAALRKKDAETASDGEAAEAEGDAGTDVPWSREALGRRLAEAAHAKRPRDFKHLPFGPYLAMGALIVLFAHATITREANLLFEAFGLRQGAPVPVRYTNAAGQTITLQGSIRSAHGSLTRNPTAPPATTPRTAP